VVPHCPAFQADYTSSRLIRAFLNSVIA